MCYFETHRDAQGNGVCQDLSLAFPYVPYRLERQKMGDGCSRVWVELDTVNHPSDLRFFVPFMARILQRLRDEGCDENDLRIDPRTNNGYDGDTESYILVTGFAPSRDTDKPEQSTGGNEARDYEEYLRLKARFEPRKEST